MKDQNPDLASTAWYLCCSGNLAGGQFLHQTCDTTSIAGALHVNTIWTLWLPHISTVKGKQALVEEDSGPKFLKGENRDYRPLHGLSIVKFRNNVHYSIDCTVISVYAAPYIAVTTVIYT